MQSGGRQRHPGRPIYNGHYVLVPPTPLKNPKLVIHSPQVSSMLGINEAEVYSDAFVKYFSGDVEGAFDSDDADGTTVADVKPPQQQQEIQTWATPYALSIMGRRYTNNCPYGTGDGYGDGRAISVGEVLVPTALSIKSNDEEREGVGGNHNRMVLEDVSNGGEKEEKHPSIISTPTMPPGTSSNSRVLVKHPFVEAPTAGPSYDPPYENSWQVKQCIILVSLPHVPYH